ncbi:hypothetical protein J6590_063891, partial [Homalodisca vitripennis]
MCSVCEGLGLNSGHPENKIACGFRAERVVYAPGFWRPYRLSLFCLQSMCVYSPVGFSDTSSEDSVFFQRREFFEVMCFGAYTVGQQGKFSLGTGSILNRKKIPTTGSRRILAEGDFRK